MKMEERKYKRNNKVLYFDDEDYIPRALTRNLELLGWDVTLVSDIDELFEKLQSEHYSIIMLDIIAPVPHQINKSINFDKNEIVQMDSGMETGIVLARKIWNLENYENVPILFISAGKQPETTIQFSKNNRVFSYIRKPELARTIDDRLNDLLNSK